MNKATYDDPKGLESLDKPTEGVHNMEEVTVDRKEFSDLSINQKEVSVSVQQEEKPEPEVKSASKYETLDESVWQTLKRDLLQIRHKLEHVLLPRFSADKGKELQKWDLWGPLLFCILLCIIVASSGSSPDAGNVFIIIFVIVWIGGLVVTLNSQFLGAPINFFQSVCLLGYCIFPIDIAAFIIRVITSANFIKLIIVAVAFVWSCFSSVGFISGIVQADKKMLAVYPFFLFFGVLSWFVLTL